MRALRSSARLPSSWVLASAVVVFLLVGRASADGLCGAMPPPLGESLQGGARADYESGKLLFTNQDFQSAIVKFQSAYDKSRDARLLWNIAATHNRLKRYARTQDFMRRYLAEARCSASPEDLVAAESAVAASENIISNVTFSVDPAGAEVFVDDESYGQVPFPSPVRLDTGQRRLKVSKSGYLEHIQTFVLGAEKNVTVRVTLAPEKRAVKPSVGAGLGEPISVPARQSPPKGGVPAWVWVAGGAVAAAGLAVGGYFIFRPGEPVSNVPAGTGGSVQLPSFHW